MCTEPIPPSRLYNNWTELTPIRFVCGEHDASVTSAAAATNYYYTDTGILYCRSMKQHVYTAQMTVSSVCIVYDIEMEFKPNTEGLGSVLLAWQLGFG